MPRRTHYNARVRVHSSAPTRLDLAGGTLDIWPLYLFHDQAQTLNAAISLRAECTLTASDDGALHIVSDDTGAATRLRPGSALDAAPEHRLVARLLHFFGTERVTVRTRSGSPVGAGLAGSSALNIALCGALARWHDRLFTPEALIDLALNLEAQVIGVPTGAQDYRPAMYGGIAAIEMGPAGITRVRLSIDAHELEARVVLAYTGQSRDSGINNWEVTKRHIDGDRETRALFDAIRDVALAMRHSLEARDWPNVGRHLAEEWELRKRLAPGVTTTTIDGIVARALAAGAYAAKICGAGGGGCLLALADPDVVPAVRSAATAAGAQVLDFRIEMDGLRVETD